MSQNNMDRRNFLKLVGSLGIITVFSPALQGCSDTIGYGYYISEEELSEYELIKYYSNVEKARENAMFCKIAVGKYNNYKSVRILAPDDNDKLTSQIIYQDNIASIDEFMNLFSKKYHVVERQPALLSIQDKVGIKSEYSAKDISTVLEQLEVEYDGLNREPASEITLTKKKKTL